ncbi:MAG: hypothetical protein JWN85_3446 [Gammaproteobacteria bacterium]|nr:hypothetical protein [Gammaproteobacteria bacterium]
MGNTDKPNVQGEGDYEAARRYRKEVKEFVDKADIDKAAHEAAPKSSAEQSEMEAAERIGRSHSKAGEERDMDLKSTTKPAK